MFFYSPSELAQKTPPADQRLRIGGLVEAAARRAQADGRRAFPRHRPAQRVQVSYRGILPDLFREGQGVVAEGALGAGRQSSSPSEVLAKHDETYMPREVAEALKKSRPLAGRASASRSAAVGQFAA